MCIVSRLPPNGCRNERPILIFFFIDGCLWLTFFSYRLPTNGCRNDRWRCYRRHTFSKVLYYCVSVCVCLHIYICTFVSTEIGGKHSAF
jgi:hypothetical protein